MHPFSDFIYVDLKGRELLTNPLYNKGLSFTEEERDEFDLHGLLPPHVASLEEQGMRYYQMFLNKSTNLEKYIFLKDILDSNETIFYHLLHHHIEEMLPIVYTPTVGQGCQHFSRNYRKPRGLFLSYPKRHLIEQILSNPKFDLVEAIVVSDGERILGLGDQGAGGMGIPIGKLALYTTCAGIHPQTTLPILLDVGTDNPHLLQNPYYIGWRHERIRGKEYEDFIELFVHQIKKRFPHVLLQWEDFAQHNALANLNKYSKEICSFNDDIQGTAAVTAGTLLAACQTSGIPLEEHRFAIVGAGSAGCGISDLLLELLLEKGLSQEEARKRFYLIDKDGLLIEGMPVTYAQKLFCQPRAHLTKWTIKDPTFISLEDVVKNAQPTVLVGVSGQGGIFTESIIREMASKTKRPIVFPLSNPTEKTEGHPKDIALWSQGKAIIGTGSPFEPIYKNNGPFRVDQINNSYVFPGIALGLISVKATHASKKMFIEAAKALAECSPSKYEPEKNLLPPFNLIRETSFKIAYAVAKQAMVEGYADTLQDEDLKNLIHSKMWIPQYKIYKKKEKSLTLK